MAGNPVPPHPFLIFILFFCPSVLFFCFCSLCVCVLISPTPLLCHQLGLSVSKSWSHCACLAFFFVLYFLLCSQTCMHGLFLWHSTNAFIAYWCTFSTIDLWLPLAEIFFVCLFKCGISTCFLLKKGVPHIFGWYLLVQTWSEYIDAPYRSDTIHYGNNVNVTRVV